MGESAKPIEKPDDAAERRARPIGIPAEGTLLLGKYRVGELVGTGGMGAVVAARHEHLDERIALKLLHSAYARDPEIRKRFKREGPAAFKLKSEHVCRVLDAGELEDGTPFIAMEFLDGRTLSNLIAERGRLPVREAVDYLLQTCLGLADAHENGIVHRDLKPSNLILTTRRDGSTCLKVIDFGISKIEGLPLSTNDVTNTYGFVGSPTYSAPEQLASARGATAKSDIWALGVVLYQMIMGTLPFAFSGDSFAIIATTIARAAPEPMTDRDRTVPKELEAIIFRCLEKDPARRFANVHDLADALAPFGPEMPTGTGRRRIDLADVLPVLPVQNAPNAQIRATPEFRTESLAPGAPGGALDNTEASGPFSMEGGPNPLTLVSSQQNKHVLTPRNGIPVIVTPAAAAGEDHDATRFAPLDSAQAPAHPMAAASVAATTTQTRVSSSVWITAAIAIGLGVLVVMVVQVTRRKEPVVVPAPSASVFVPMATVTVATAAAPSEAPTASATATATAAATATSHPTTRPTTHATRHVPTAAPTESSPKILKDWQGKF